jgi:four helix bundle protein
VIVEDLVRSNEFGELKMNNGKFDFESLIVHQKALEYVDLVYKMTRNFPKAEVFSLTDQFKRASISICLNIAEVSGGSKVEFNRFLKIARRSIRECIAITEISYRQNFISKDMKDQSRSLCSEL